LQVIKPPHHLRLEPADATIKLGGSQGYQAFAVAEDGEELGEVTKQTVFSISQQGQPSGSCKEASCTPAKAGKHTVTGIFTPDDRVKGEAVLQVIKPPHHLRLEPADATIKLGKAVTYKAFAEAEDNTQLGEVTGQTVFAIDQDGPCQGASCTPTKAGKHTVTGHLKDQPAVQGTATLQVTEPPKAPSISSVTPDFLPAGSLVEVGGNTGSCNRSGTLAFHGIPNEASVTVTGDRDGEFVASFTVPTGTYPMSFKLELTVDCNGQLQRAESEVTVINLAPVAADDFAVTTQDTPVAIAVTGNDRNPDPNTGYQTLVVQDGSPPPNGTIQVQPNGIIVYTPRAGFLGRDQFRYGLCDNVINAAGTADCGTATVTVTVNPGTPTTPGPPGGGPPGGGPPGSGPPGGGAPGGGPAGGGSPLAKPCAPSASDLQQRLQVTPIKGPGGTKLQITAKVDQKLAACSLRLLFGGAPLGPDISVGPDGSISAQPPVPTDAIPGGSTLRLTTTGGQVLDETSFEILPTLLRRWWQRNPYRSLLGVAALLAGALAGAAIRRLRRLLQEDDQDDPDPPRQPNFRAEAHTRPVEVTVEPATKDGRTITVRLQPHGDPGIQTLQEVPG
jgi:hypothetical protein